MLKFVDQSTVIYLNLSKSTWHNFSSLLFNNLHVQSNNLISDAVSATRLGNILHFGQLFKACGNNYFAQIAHILGNFCKSVIVFNFSTEIFFGQLS